MTTEGQRKQERALELLYPSIWAERYRVLDGEPYSFRGREFLRQIHNDRRPHVVFEKGNQAGATEAVQNIACCEIDAGNSVMMVFPTEKVAKRHVAARFNPMLVESPRIRSLFDDTNSLEVKTSLDLGRALYFEGSGSKSGAHSVPVSTLIIDEFDRCDPDTIDEFDKRLSGQKNPRRLWVSTPTYPERGIDAAFLDSDQKYWVVACPHCDHRGVLEWTEHERDGRPVAAAVVRWPSWPDDRFTSIDEREHQAAGSFLQCARCSKPWSPAEHRAAVSAGEWVAVHPNRLVSGYTINQLHSPTRSISVIVGEYLAAAISETPMAMQTFQNGVLGRAYIGKSEIITLGEVERLFVTAKQVPSEDGISLGADIGGTKHCAIGGVIDGRLVAEYLPVPTFGDLEDLIRNRRVSSAVVDAWPEKESAERLCEQFPGVVFRCFTPQEQQIPDVWDAANGIVRISRVSMVSTIHRRIRGGTLMIVRNENAIEASLHLTRVALIAGIDQHGDPTRIVRKISRVDHYFWATLYLELAARRIVSNVPFEIHEDRTFGVDRGMTIVGSAPLGIDEFVGITDVGEDPDVDPEVSAWGRF